MNNATPVNPNSKPDTQADTKTDALVISAIALGLIAAVQLGIKMGAGSPEPTALAEMAASVGEFKIMTTASNDNEEQLFVLDNRNEQLMVYGVNQNTGLQLQAREPLDQVFASARAASGGNRRP